MHVAGDGKRTTRHIRQSNEKFLDWIQWLECGVGLGQNPAENGTFTNTEGPHVLPETSIDLLAFNVKLLGTQRRKNVLISAGKVADKEKLLESMKTLAGLNVQIFATPGTQRFLNQHSIASTEVHKIADGLEPNILSLLKRNGFDLVINILTGNQDYDEKSDVNLIRTLSIENGIPLITDTDVAVKTIAQLALDHQRGTFRYKQASRLSPWDMRSHFLSLIRSRGGFACHHAHFDKAYLISPDNLRLSQVDMQRKWELYKYLKENYTMEDLIERISRGVQVLIAQGATYCRTMVDADSTVKLLPIMAANEVKRMFADRIRMEVGIQPLQGVVNDLESRKLVEEACGLADFVGGLPSRDRPTPEKHLDIVMEIAKSQGKMLDVHVDQENNPWENETEMLARKTIEHGLEGRVFAVHAISLAAKPHGEQDRIISIMKDAGVSVICCPSAALSMKMLDMTAPLHNSIAPVVRLLEAEVPVYLGVDNINDLFMPLVDGDMWFECRCLMESCRFYELERVADIATRLISQPA
jgi:cytosine deaminase